MRQGPGYWLNPDTQQLERVSRHETYLLDAPSAIAIGLNQTTYAKIMLLNPARDQDTIRILAMRDGLIRMRDNNNYYAVEFWCNRGHVRQVLWEVALALEKLHVHQDTELMLHNVQYKDVAKITLANFRERLHDDLPILKEAIAVSRDLADS